MLETVKKRLVWLMVLMTAVFALSRWPGLMPQNFSAAYGILFCAGLYFPGWLGWFIPMAVMTAIDLFLNIFYYHMPFSLGAFLGVEAPLWLAFLALIGLGRWFGAKRSWLALLGGGIMGAILFYVITNTAAWLTLPYARTFAGWIQAITTGFIDPNYPQTWEFFRNTLLSGGLFTGLFVASMKLTEEPETADEKEAEGSPESEPETEPAAADAR